MDEESNSYDMIIDRTIRLRERLLEKLVNKDTIAVDDRDFAIKLLDGLDRTLLTNKKIKSDEKISESVRENARSIVADILSNLTVKNNLKAPRELEVDYIPTDIVEGEVYIGIENLSLDDIAK